MKYRAFSFKISTFLLLRTCAASAADVATIFMLLKKWTLFLNQKLICSKKLLIAVGLFSLIINGCEGPLINNTTDINLELSSKPRILRVGFLKNSLSYGTQDKQKKIGLEYDLIEDFAQSLKFKIKYFEFNTATELAVALESKKIDLTAIRGVLEVNDEKIIQGPTYDETHLSLFCRKNDQIENFTDLSNSTLITTDSHWHLLKKNSQLQNIENLKLYSFSKNNSFQVLSEVAWQRADCAVLESVEGLYFSRYFITIEEVTALEEGVPLSFYLSTEQSQVNELLAIWLQNARRENTISKFLDRYESLAVNIDEHDVHGFKNDITEKLPSLKKYFLQASLKSKIPWRWIASVAYQESNWEQDSLSNMGAAGIMQLTEETAKRLGVNDRYNVQANILGGAEYLNMLYSHWPKNIPSQDRWALTLVSYNMGLGHLKDAQSLAIDKKRNPFSWNELKKVLPLLEEEKYFLQTRHGKARGHETVKFVNRVFAFQDLLIHQVK